MTPLSAKQILLDRIFNAQSLWCDELNALKCSEINASAKLHWETEALKLAH